MKVLAWVIEKGAACPDCGTRLEEWDPKKGGHRQAYAAVTFRCPGCMQSEAVWTDIHKQDHHEGIKVRLEPTIFHPQHRPKI